MSETGEEAVAGLLGDKLYQQRARLALPVLVRQAKARQPIQYNELAAEIGMPNPRNLNWPLGAIGNEMLRLGEHWGVKVPPIQALVVNKDTGLPGEGISWFAPDAAKFRSSSRQTRKQIVDLMLSEVYEFDRWDEVLSTYGLTPLPPLVDHLPTLEEVHVAHGVGEGEADRTLKMAVAAHPEWLGLPISIGPGEIECALYSGDRVDVIFADPERRVAVEVKPEQAPEADLVVRGMFQCVKYEAVLRAEESVAQTQRDCSSILVLGGKLPIILRSLRATLNVEVREGMAVREA